jgi:hypothetical protein
MGLLQSQEGQRHADVVVKAGIAPERRHFLAEDGSDQLFGAGFAVGPGDGDDRQREVISIFRRDPAEGATRIVDGDYGAFERVGGDFRAVKHDGGDAFLGGFTQEIVAVEAVTRERNEQIIPLRLA